jgi:DNA repair exonuclease SbcCD ATPase subunit
MIVFEKIKWKNFLSTGNHFIEVDLNKVSNTLIIGSNGAGKSTILDALTFVLFGKAFRKINKPQLINSTNEKDCVVEIEFSIGSTSWKVVRGIKPSIFEIYRNDDLLNQQSSSVDQQKFLEQTVLKMNYKSFTQIVILGSSNFVPFMQLPAQGRREVIEDLLDIKIFSTMNLLIKDKLKMFKEDIRVFELKKESLREKVEMQKSFIEELENRGKEDIKNKKISILSLVEDIGYLNGDVEDLQKNILELNLELEKNSGSSEKLRKLGNLKGKITEKIKTIIENHKFFSENQICPTCTQEIDESFRHSKIDEAKEKSKELQDGYTELESTIKEEEEKEKIFLNISNQVLKLNQEISKNNTKVSEYNKRIKQIENEIYVLDNQLKNKNEEHEKLETYQEKLESTYNDIVDMKTKMDHYDFCQNLLKDGGVKTKIIEKYLPLINQQVNKYLQMMDFFINFSFDKEFNESILSPIHEDFTYSSFSEGEKQRIDLSLLFAWREVAKFKNSTNTNLLILDEIFDSSLDGFGTDDFLKIVRYVIKDSNTFIISHKESLHDKFDNVIKFEKRKNFSYKSEVQCQN